VLVAGPFRAVALEPAIECDFVLDVSLLLVFLDSALPSVAAIDAVSTRETSPERLRCTLADSPW